MKKNEIKELLTLGSSAISGKITEFENKIAKFDLELKRGKQKNPREGKNLRRLVAVLKTKLTEGVK